MVKVRSHILAVPYSEHDKSDPVQPLCEHPQEKRGQSDHLMRRVTNSTHVVVHDGLSYQTCHHSPANHHMCVTGSRCKNEKGLAAHSRHSDPSVLPP